MSLVISNVLLTRDLCHQKSARKTDFTRSRRDGGDYEPVNQVASIRGLHTHGEGLSPPLSLVTRHFPLIADPLDQSSFARAASAARSTGGRGFNPSSMAASLSFAAKFFS